MSSKSQIVATIGPSSKSVETLTAMIAHQMDLARLNFSWGTHPQHLELIKNIRAAASTAGRRVPIIQDLSGPRIQYASGHGFNPEVKEVLTPKDIDDLQFGLAQDIDYVAMSFVGIAADVLNLKAEIKKAGKSTPVIAKIERAIAIENIDEIIKVADAIMIARGDLGNEVPVEQIPFIERTIAQKCRAAGKPVITATQMMLSMVTSSTPTRAEVTDVAFAILSGSDAVMLSEETANGAHPVEVVAMMEKIVLEAERHLDGSVDVNQLK